MSDFYCEQILNGVLQVDVVAETSQILAFKHTAPYWPVHIVLIPKKHIESIAALTEEDSSLIQDVMRTTAKLAAEITELHGGCRFSTNVGSYQSTKHLHWYLHAGTRIRDESGKLLAQSS